MNTGDEANTDRADENTRATDTGPTDACAMDTRKVNKRSRNRLILLGSVILSIVALDQITKFWALAALSDQPYIEVIGSAVRLTLVYNYGGALGTNFGPTGFYLAMSMAVLGILFYFLWSYRKHPSLSVPLALIAGGAIGNIIDRIRLGKVVDWIDVDFVDISLFGYQLERWWTFNVADAAISVSLILMLWSSFRHQDKDTPPKEDTKSNAESVTNPAPVSDQTCLTTDKDGLT